ncbi:MAG: monofunctional biosynthetic peptidoglycan transglycosylase [Alphaproteobacteria bacterium]|nr:monofunctional biosynthetic peptidoglycan transglycosylase [Alphaproteobacteria bacterium]
MFFTVLIRLSLVLTAAVMLLTLCFAVIPPVSSVMLQSAVRGDGMARRWVPLRAISPSMLRAVIAAEDARFCDHRGIDWKAAEAAYARNERAGRVTHGASTISMQTAKNLFLWNGRSWLRKALEAPIALWVDGVLTKRRVLEIYLNTAEWGTGVFGIEEASRRAFGKPAYLLSAQESSLLAAALPAPRARNAARPTRAQRALAGTIQSRLTHVDIGCIRH